MSSKMSSKRMKTRILLGAIALLVATALDFQLPGHTAEAIIGRPLTPMSYAGVARRTTRRTVYAAGAYGAPYASPYVW